MPNEVDEFMKGLDEEVQDPFTPNTEDPFAKADVVGETKKQEDEEAKPLPFHKDPKVQRYVEKEITKALEKVKPVEVIKESKEEGDEIVEVLTRIIGNDTPEKLSAIKDFKKVLGGLEEKGAQRALREIEERQNRLTEEDQQAQSELKQGFEDIEETYGVDITSNAPVARKTRDEFVEYIRKIAPKDSDGEVSAFPDLIASFEEFQERKKNVPAANSRAKDLSVRSMARSTDASKAPVTTDRSWDAVDKFFSKFSS